MSAAQGMSGARAICVYCGSKAGTSPVFAQAAAALGAAIARDRLTLVYGGASVGLMGVIADAALAAGGRVVGVIPRMLLRKEIAHPGLADLIVTESMHERKARMAALSDAFIALPGSIGTLDELFEMWTWAQLRLHTKPCVLVNTAGYYDGLRAYFDRAAREGFLRPEVRAMLQIVPEVASPRALFPA